MDRRNFLKALSILGVSSLIPKNALPIINIIEQREYKPYELIGVTDDCKKKFTNHMTIQRKTVKITGGEMHKTIYFKYEPQTIPSTSKA